jgi:hypothetical protein
MANIDVEITDPHEFHCFRLILRPATQPGGDDRQPIEIMLHASALVDLIHKSSLALCEWQRQTTEDLLQKLTGMTAEELRAKGMIA